MSDLFAWQIRGWRVLSRIPRNPMANRVAMGTRIRTRRSRCLLPVVPSLRAGSRHAMFTHDLIGSTSGCTRQAAWTSEDTPYEGIDHNSVPNWNESFQFL